MEDCSAKDLGLSSKASKKYKSSPESEEKTAGISENKVKQVEDQLSQSKADADEH